jgi:hypothetical protein
LMIPNLVVTWPAVPASSRPSKWSRFVAAPSLSDELVEQVAISRAFAGNVAVVKSEALTWRNSRTGLETVVDEIFSAP